MSRINKHIALGLLVLVLVNTLATVVVVGSFYANRSFFAQNFCVNKTKPTLCMGSCHLTKVLKNLPDQQDEPVALKLSQLSFEYISVFTVLELIFPIQEKTKKSLFYKNDYRFFFFSKLAPPPRA